MYSNIPKVLHKLGGKSLLTHVLETSKNLGPEKICVVYGHGGAAVMEAIADNTITWAKQEPQLGTGHAVMQALPHINRNGIALILYGDVPLIAAATLKKLTQLAQSNKLAVLTIELADPHGYGRIVRDKNHNVTAIVEEKDANETQRQIKEINTGIMALPVKRLEGWLSKLDNKNAQKEYYLTDIISLAAQESFEIATAQPEHAWEVTGVNDKKQLSQLERVYQLAKIKELLSKGVTFYDPARVDIRGTLNCGSDVTIDVNCIFEGDVTLADKVTIGANCILKNVVVGEGAQIAPFSLIDEAQIGTNCRIGPFARIRPGTKLDEEVHVGNFVEVKNTQIAARSKANHLSYLGDAKIGKDVNVGAGTITCNYDGANKHQTVIEDNVFIGSDTQLVAPVTVRRGATIGAGTTITKEVPAERLTLSRVEQKTIGDWQRPVKKK
jgi:bifunctional UDP-N-acetylglucosamine pyrophosphorylase/glucosamine-1-phosphate N-acetyltransferase